MEIALYLTSMMNLREQTIFVPPTKVNCGNLVPKNPVNENKKQFHEQQWDWKGRNKNERIINNNNNNINNNNYNSFKNRPQQQQQQNQ